MNPVSMRRLCLLVALALFGTQADVHACSYPDPPPFSEVLDKAVSVAVVRVEEVRVKQKGVRDVVATPELEADVRVTETLAGHPAVVANLSFSGDWCGGHDLKVGGYYVLVLRDNRTAVELIPGDPSVLYLFGQYDEQAGSKGSKSALLVALHEYARSHRFPAAFPFRDYIDVNFAHALLPAWQRRPASSTGEELR